MAASQDVVNLKGASQGILTVGVICSAVMPLPLNCDLRLDVLVWGPHGFKVWVSVLIESTWRF